MCAGEHVTVRVERLSIDVRRSPDGFVWDRLRLQFGDDSDETTDPFGVTPLVHAAFGDGRSVRTKPCSMITLRCCSWKARRGEQIESAAPSARSGPKNLTITEVVDPGWLGAVADLLATIHWSEQHPGRPSGEGIGRTIGLRLDRASEEKRTGDRVPTLFAVLRRVRPRFCRAHTSGFVIFTMLVKPEAQAGRP